MSTLSVGSKVRVRNDLVEDEYYDEILFIEDMVNFKGRVVTIAAVFNSHFNIKEDDGVWAWSLLMFEPIIKVGDYVRDVIGDERWVTDIDFIYPYPYTLSNDVNDIGKSFSQMTVERPNDSLWRASRLEDIELFEKDESKTGDYVPLTNSSIILEPLGDSNDEVHSPSYYAERKIEVMDFIKDTCENNDMLDAYGGYQYGSVQKYIPRAGLKVYGDKTAQESMVTDLKKAQEHLERWIRYEESKL